MCGVLSRPVMPRTLFLTLGILLPVLVAAEPLAEPPVIESAGGSLGLLVVAREQRLGGLPGQPVGWVYAQGERGSGEDPMSAATAVSGSLSPSAPPEGAAP